MLSPYPLVSVIMPVYNSSEYLIESIESILNQTFRNFELIIINDGSTDESEKIIKSYADKRIVFFIQENKGLASTLNRELMKLGVIGLLVWMLTIFLIQIDWKSN